LKLRAFSNQPTIFFIAEPFSSNEIKEIFALFDKTQKGQV